MPKKVITCNCVDLDNDMYWGGKINARLCRGD